MKEHADKALQYFISVEPSKALSLLLVRCMNFQFLHISNPVIEIFPRTSHWDFFMGEIIAKALIDAIIVPTLLLFVISDIFCY